MDIKLDQSQATRHHEETQSNIGDLDFPRSPDALSTYTSNPTTTETAPCSTEYSGAACSVWSPRFFSGAEMDQQSSRLVACETVDKWTTIGAGSCCADVQMWKRARVPEGCASKETAHWRKMCRSRRLNNDTAPHVSFSDSSCDFVTLMSARSAKKGYRRAHSTGNLRCFAYASVASGEVSLLSQPGDVSFCWPCPWALRPTCEVISECCRDCIARECWRSHESSEYQSVTRSCWPW